MLKIEMSMDPSAAPSDRMITAALLHALANAFSGVTVTTMSGETLVQGVSETATAAAPARRGRPPKAVDPVAAYAAAGGVLPDAPPADAPPADAPPAVTFGLVADMVAAGIDPWHLPVGAPPMPPADADPRTIDELRVAMREAAIQKGALWLRPHLQGSKVAKIGDMPIEALRAALAAEGR